MTSEAGLTVIRQAARELAHLASDLTTATFTPGIEERQLWAKVNEMRDCLNTIRNYASV